MGDQVTPDTEPVLMFPMDAVEAAIKRACAGRSGYRIWIGPDELRVVLRCDGAPIVPYVDMDLDGLRAIETRKMLEEFVEREVSAYLDRYVPR